MADYLAWLRRQLGPHLLPLAYATAIIQDEAGRVLFQRRADFDDAWWGLPGGLLEPGETPEACARREALEETGLRIEPQRLIGVYSSPRYTVHYPNGHVAQQITSCHLCRITGGRLRPQAEEILQLRFFSPSALPARPAWYADMLTHALDENRATPYFDLPEKRAVATPFPTLMAARKAIGPQAIVWPGANAVVRDEQGRILLQHRMDFDVWGLPGGSLDTGETVAHTAIRETLEETGVQIELVRLVGVFSGYRVEYPHGDVLYPVVHTFEARAVGGAPRADGRETQAAQFFPPDQLPPLPPPIQQRIALALG